mgnify:CR=1 FL=1
MSNDLRLALRALGAKPWHSVAGVVMLALGIGVNAAVFSLLDALYFRPVPLREPERLVRVSRPSSRTVFALLSHPELRELAAATPALGDVVAVGGRGVTLHHRGEVRLLIVKYVSTNFFDALGAKAALGRTFLAGEEEPGRDQVVVLKHSLWQRRFGSDPNMVGRSLTFNGKTFSVVGVMPADFNFPFNGGELDPVVNARNLTFWAAHKTHPVALRGKEFHQIRQVKLALGVVGADFR